MVIDGHVHIGTSQYLQVHADTGMLMGIADELGFDRIFVTHLTALFYEMGCVLIKRARARIRRTHGAD